MQVADAWLWRILAISTDVLLQKTFFHLIDLPSLNDDDARTMCRAKALMLGKSRRTNDKEHWLRPRCRVEIDDRVHIAPALQGGAVRRRSVPRCPLAYLFDCPAAQTLGEKPIQESEIDCALESWSIDCRTDGRQAVGFIGLENSRSPSDMPAVGAFSAESSPLESTAPYLESVSEHYARSLSIAAIGMRRRDLPRSSGRIFQFQTRH